MGFITLLKIGAQTILHGFSRLGMNLSCHEPLDSTVQPLPTTFDKHKAQRVIFFCIGNFESRLSSGPKQGPGAKIWHRTYICPRPKPTPSVQFIRDDLGEVTEEERCAGNRTQRNRSPHAHESELNAKTSQIQKQWVRCMILLGLTTILIRALLDDRHVLISIATDGLVEQTNNDHRFLILEKKRQHWTKNVIYQYQVQNA